MKKYLYTCCLSLLATLAFIPGAYAQDPRFAQFYKAPLHLNPAMTGSFEGKVRMSVNYRDLYSSVLADRPYRTIGAGFDMRFRAVKNDYIGVGLSFLRDQVGTSRFSRTHGNLGLSFMKQLGGSRYKTDDQYLIAGAQVGFGQHNFDAQRLWFSNQFDPNNGLIDFDSPSGENFDDQGPRLFLDFNAGILWYALFGENMSIYAGGAVHHLTTPNVSFLEDQEEKLYRRWVVHGGGEIPVVDALSILPAAVFMLQGPSMSTTFGANLRYTHRDWKELAIRAGAWGHLNNDLNRSFGFDAVIFTAILELERWNLGFSYDVTVSNLTDVNNSRGAFEVSLVYFLPEKSRYRVECPKY